MPDLMVEQEKYYAHIIDDDGSGYAHTSFQVFDSEQELLDAGLMDTDTISGEMHELPNCRVFFKGTEVGFERHVAEYFGNKDTKHNDWAPWIKSRMLNKNNEEKL